MRERKEPHVYAFLSHWSALEALRALPCDPSDLPSWPHDLRLLPIWGECVTNQTMFREFSEEVDFSAHGILERPVDLLVPIASRRSKGKRARFHVWKNVLPLESMLRLEEKLLLSSPEFTFIQLAGYHPRFEPISEQFTKELWEAREARAAAGPFGEPVYDNPFDWDLKMRLVGLMQVACELLGTYRIGGRHHKTTYEQKPLMTRESVLKMVDGIVSLYGATRIRMALAAAFDNAASPMEANLALMLCLPAEFGGYELPRPELNVKLRFERVDLNGVKRSIRPDLYWPDRKVVLEYEGEGSHVALGPEKIADDASRANSMLAKKVNVLRATTNSVNSFERMDLLAHQVADALAIKIPEPDELTLIRRRKLYLWLRRT